MVHEAGTPCAYLSRSVIACATVLVVTTIGIFVTGILLLASGHKSDQLLLTYKVFFFVWGPIFGIHSSPMPVACSAPSSCPMGYEAAPCPHAGRVATSRR